MGQALYRKYRSKSLAEIVGQEHITDTLSQAIATGRLSHAYLFTGPRGVGKTSIARILAHEINGLPYQSETNHVDIIEIDAASNRGIDEIRDLREKVYAAPLEAKYKVYIIDEVHMLTTPAFNALLKTLEEPPAHVIFILATTEAHKLPETIVSRTQRHIFRPVETDKVVGHLKHIAKQEKIKIDDAALRLIAQHGGGSFRDSISLLDQAGSSDQKIDRQRAEELLGIPPDNQVDTLVETLRTGQAAELMATLLQLSNNGFHAAAIAQKLGVLLRQGIISNQPLLPMDRQLKLLRSLLDVAPANDPNRMLEIVLLQALPVNTSSVASEAHGVPDVVPNMPEAAAPVATRKLKVATATSVTHVKVEPKSEDKVAAMSNELLDAALWPNILDELKKTHNTLDGVMRMAVPEFEPGLLRLRFQFAFHQKRMNEAKHRAIVGDIILRLSGNNIAIECVHDKEALVGGGPVGSNHPAAEELPHPVPPSSLSTISNIFGGGELLES
jgi:DNA polymerase-3 subunit gamma/tau